MAVAVEDPLLGVAGMSAESLELQSGFQIPQQMNMTALYKNTVGFEHLRETRQAVNRRCREHDARCQEFLQKVIENLRRLLAGTQLSFQ